MSYIKSKHFHIQLLLALSEAINHSFYTTSVSEPQLIANLVQNLPFIINNQYHYFFPNSFYPNISCGSVFVHGTPLVAPYNEQEHPFPQKTPKSVEIGDLLLISTIHKNMKTKRNALLLQAKKLSYACDINKYIDNYKYLDNLNQYYLYSKWPPFKFIKGIKIPQGPNMICATDRCKNCKYSQKDFIDLSNEDLRQTTQYLFISENEYCNKSTYDAKIHSYIRSKRCYCCLPKALLQNPCYTAELDIEINFSNLASFNSMLLHFILGKEGKTFNSPCSTDWDFLINILINSNKNKISAFMNGSQINNNKQSPRGQGALCFLPNSRSERSKSFFDYSTLIQNITINNEINTIYDHNLFDDSLYKNSDWNDGINIIEFVTNYDIDR